MFVNDTLPWEAVPDWRAKLVWREIWTVFSHGNEVPGSCDQMHFFSSSIIDLESLSVLTDLEKKKIPLAPRVHGPCLHIFQYEMFSYFLSHGRCLVCLFSEMFVRFRFLFTTSLNLSLDRHCFLSPSRNWADNSCLRSLAKFNVQRLCVSAWPSH